MEEEFAPYNLSLRLKQLGFDEPCMAAFEDNGKLFIYWNDLASKDELFCSQKVCEQLDYECLVPTFSQAFRWFREKGEDCIILPTSNLYTPVVYNEKTSGKKKELYDTYEEAELACLKKLIEIVEQRNAEMTEHGVYK